MANKRLQDLSQAGSLSDSDQIYIEQGNAAFRVTLAALKSYLGVTSLPIGTAQHLAAAGAVVAAATANLRDTPAGQDHLAASGAGVATAAANLRRSQHLAAGGLGVATATANLEDVAGTPSMPTGLVGYWNTDTYNSTAKTITNEVDGTAPVQNLFRFPRRNFGAGVSWTAPNSTVTDDYAAGPDGLTQASRLVGTGQFWGLYKTLTTPAGSYALAYSVKSNTGASQNFQSWVGSAGFFSKTATTSWQRIVIPVTLTAASQNIYPFFSSQSGTPDVDLLICDVELYAGGADLGPALPKGHLQLGLNAYAAPAVTSGLIASGSLGGVIDFPSTMTMTTFTAFAVASKTSSTVTYQGYMSKINGYTSFGPSFEVNDVATQFFGGQQSDGKNAKIRNPLGMGVLMHTTRYDGTNLDTFINDVLVGRVTGTFSAQTVREMWFGLVNGAFSIDYNVYSMGLANRAWSNAEIANAVAAQKARATTSGVTMNLTTRYYVAEGDSRSAEGSNFPQIYNANASPKVIGYAAAVSGSTLATMSARASATDALMKPGVTNILSIIIGANDLTSGYGGASSASQAATNYLTDLAVYCDARRAAGWKVIMTTFLPVTVAARASYNSTRGFVNTGLATWVGVHCDGLADFAADATMGPDAAASNTTYYPDGLHPSAAGHAILETIFRPVANAIT